MKIGRAIGFGVLLTIALLFIVAIIALIGQAEFFRVHPRLLTGTLWLISFVMTLILAKWYFRVDAPTTKKGLYLGLVGVSVFLIICLLLIAPYLLSGEDFVPWSKYLLDNILIGMLVAVLLACTYAGFEFDATFTAVGESKDNIDNKNK